MKVSQLYNVFYSKLPLDVKELLPESNKSKYITFLNPFYIEKYSQMVDLYKRFDYICSDGMVPIQLNKIWGKKKSWRCSFDMSGLAGEVFQWLVKHNDSVYFLGTTQDKLERFVEVLQKSFPSLNIVGTHHGYIKGQEDEVVAEIIKLKPTVVVIGMGAPLQDQFAMRLRDAGFQGTIYTCGGFMHQTSERLNYYPAWINRWNLRTFYRLTRERYVWGRVIKYYPKFIIKYSLFLLFGGKNMNC